MLTVFDFDIPWEPIDTGSVAPLGILVQFITLWYSFMGLAIVCDDHLVPALETLCTKLEIPEDVAGATFMAFGSAAPEIVIAAVSTLQSQLANGHNSEEMQDAIELGVSSIIGSGLIAFSLIPAVCGLSVPEDQPLVLKRRPLLRDELAYFLSLLALMWVIADEEVHAYEAAVLLVLYVLYLLVIVFSHGIRVWFIEEWLKEAYVSTKEPIAMDEHTGGHYDALPNNEVDWGTPIFIKFNERPIMTLEPGENGLNAYVLSVSNIEIEEPNLISEGMQIMEITGSSCYDKPFEQIERMLREKDVPMIIKFQTPALVHRPSVETWDTERVKEWWETLPPACRDYEFIIDECHMNGDDLVDLDWQMLDEFGVKKMHAMKILKHIKQLVGAKQLLDSEISTVEDKLRGWNVSEQLITQVSQDIHSNYGRPMNGDSADNQSGHGSDADEEEGFCGSMWDTLAAPLECLFHATCPTCELNTPGEGYYWVTLLASFLWISVFSFMLSSVIERWVAQTHVPMAFFGLLLVSIAAQVPDTLESLAVAKEGKGSMAIGNCLGTQTINIGIGLGLPWLVTSSNTGGEPTKLNKVLLIPCYFMLGVIIFSLLIYFSTCKDIKEEVTLTRFKSWLLVILYFVSIAGYAIALVLTGNF